MSTGRTNWRDLYAYFENELKKLPRNSPLRPMVQRQLTNIAAVASSNGISIEGGTAPAEVSMAEPGTNLYDDDSKLTALTNDAVNDQILYLMATHNGVYPEGDRPLESYIGRMLYDGTIEELRAGMIADARIQETVLADILAGKTSLQDPVSGVWFDVTPEFTTGVINQWNETQIGLLGLERGMGAQGAFDDRLDKWEAGQRSLVAPIITTVVNPIGDNPSTEVDESQVAGLQGYRNQGMEEANMLRNMALQSTNPAETKRLLIAAGNVLKRTSSQLQTWIAGLPEGYAVEDWLTEDFKYDGQVADFLINAPNMTQEEASAAGAELFNGHPGDNYYWSESELLDTIGSPQGPIGYGRGGSPTNDERAAALGGAMEEPDVSRGDRYSPGWTGLIGSIAAEDGLNVTAATRLGEEPAIGGEAFVYVVPFGQTEPVAVPAGEAAGYLQGLSDNPLFDQGFKAGTVPSTEVITLPNGRHQNTIVWRERQALPEEQTTWWSKKDSRGNMVWATEEDYKTFGEDPIRAGQEGWTRTPFAGLEKFSLVTTASGQQVYVNGVTGQIYVSPPLSLPVGFNFLVTDLIDDNGKQKEEYGYVTYNGTFHLSDGSMDPRAEQALLGAALNSGEISIDDYLWLDETTGIPTNPPTIQQILDHTAKNQTIEGNLGGWQRGRMEGALRADMGRAERSYLAQARREMNSAANARERDFMAQGRHGAAPFVRDARERAPDMIEVGQKQTGVHFGAAAENLTRPFTGEGDETSRLAPVNIDALKPMNQAESLAAVRLPPEPYTQANALDAVRAEGLAPYRPPTVQAPVPTPSPGPAPVPYAKPKTSKTKTKTTPRPGGYRPT